VEFALLMPLLLLLVVGIAELGRAYHLQTVLSGAARDAVRVMALYDDPAAARAAAKASATGVALTDQQISVSPASCAATGTTSPGTATVTVTVPVKLITGLLGTDLTLTGKGTMRCNG
jgi:Flp pilus assembly protein TadG